MISNFVIGVFFYVKRKGYLNPNNTRVFDTFVYSLAMMLMFVVMSESLATEIRFMSIINGCISVIMMKVYMITAGVIMTSPLSYLTLFAMTILCIFVSAGDKRGNPRGGTKGTERLKWIKNEESELPVGTYSRRCILY